MSVGCGLSVAPYWVVKLSGGTTVSTVDPASVLSLGDAVAYPVVALKWSVTVRPLSTAAAREREYIVMSVFRALRAFAFRIAVVSFGKPIRQTRPAMAIAISVSTSVNPLR